MTAELSSIESPFPHNIKPELRDFAAVSAWLLIQSLALIAANSSWTPWARFDGSLSRYASQLMSIAQVSFAAMLFPILLATARRSVIAIMSIPPFVMLAAMLSETPFDAAFRAALFTALWFSVLAILLRECRTERAKVLVAATVALFTFGPVALSYASQEFVGSSTNPIWLDGPLLGVIASYRGWNGEAWSFPIALLVAVMSISRVRHSFATTHSG